MIKFIVGICVLLSSVSQAAGVLPEPCVKKAALRIVRFLQSDEPQSNVQVVKNSAGAVIALMDAAQIYPNYDLVTVEAHEPGVYTVLFQADSQIVFARVQFPTKSSRTRCQILEVDSGQDDQD